MREIVHIQAGQCGNQIGAKVGKALVVFFHNNLCLDDFTTRMHIECVKLHQTRKVRRLSIINIHGRAQLQM